MNVVVFANQKGGTGKSTLSVLYALWLAERRGQRVGFIDLDSQGNASKTLRAHDYGYASRRLFGAGDTPGYAPAPNKLVLFPADVALIDVERMPPEEAIPVFRQRLGSLGEVLDVCVIDTPPALGLRMSAALMAGTHVVCPIELEEYSIDGVTQMLQTVFGVRRKYNPALRLVGIVANRFNGHSVRQKLALADLLRSYREFVVPARISIRSAIPEGLAEGLPVWRLAKTSAREASEEILRVFELLQARIEKPSRSLREVA
ncbi:MAG: ParA family protein [Proteobacteria bacterium]|nr:ParA family protein [Pseudomonadota bacterium]